jgi:predicted DNA-binding transcriptional regulator AlpA
MKDPIKPRCLTTRDAARYLGLSVSLLRKYRLMGPDDPGTHGPKFIRISQQLIVYDIKELDAWVESFKAPETTKARC